MADGTQPGSLQPVPAPTATDTLVEAALKILNEPDPWRKAEFTYAVYDMWKAGTITRIIPDDPSQLVVPERPARADDKVKLLAPGAMPKRGKGGTLASRQSLLHSLVHIENWAIDLSWDIIARFGVHQPHYCLPKAFFDDFVQVAEDECRHFSLLCKRLEAIGSSYGALPAHDGLWESASCTAASLPARLAVEHCTHEARGLDVLPTTIHRFRSNGDTETADLLQNVIYAEEISHCAAGVRWLTYLHKLAHEGGSQEGSAASSSQSGCGSSTAAQQAACDAAAGAAGSLSTAMNGISLDSKPAADGAAAGAADAAAGAADAADTTAAVPGGQQCGSAAPHDWRGEAAQHARVEAWFHSLIRRHFHGSLKPPFNEEARAKAGFGPEWYLPVARS